MEHTQRQEPRYYVFSKHVPRIGQVEIRTMVDEVNDAMWLSILDLSRSLSMKMKYSLVYKAKTYFKQTHMPILSHPQGSVGMHTMWVSDLDGARFYVNRYEKQLDEIGISKAARLGLLEDLRAFKDARLKEIRDFKATSEQYISKENLINEFTEKFRDLLADFYDKAGKVHKSHQSSFAFPLPEHLPNGKNHVTETVSQESRDEFRRRARELSKRLGISSKQIRTHIYARVLQEIGFPRSDSLWDHPEYFDDAVQALSRLEKEAQG